MRMIGGKGVTEDRKTSVNNIVIVWQGQSWSAIAPNGYVLGRFPSKRLAFDFAKNNTTYISSDIPVDNYLDEHFIEFKDDLPRYPEKPKRGHHFGQSLGDMLSPDEKPKRGDNSAVGQYTEATLLERIKQISW
jgi:hypothetical protein